MYEVQKNVCEDSESSRWGYSPNKPVQARWESVAPLG